MNNDRELLELAARADSRIPKEFEGNEQFLEGLFNHWNPLLDDGDALRLAVNLSIFTDHYAKFRHELMILFNASSEQSTATRRAIVSAAASQITN